jgi:hypothetical protein
VEAKLDLILHQGASTFRLTGEHITGAIKWSDANFAFAQLRPPESSHPLATPVVQPPTLGGCREPLRALAHKPVVPRTTLTLWSRRSQWRHGVRGSSSLAGPQAWHSQRYGTVLSGQRRITTKRPRPAPFPALAGDSSDQTGIGSRGRRSTFVRSKGIPVKRVYWRPRRVITANVLWSFLDRVWERVLSTHQRATRSAQGAAMSNAPEATHLARSGRPANHPRPPPQAHPRNPTARRPSKMPAPYGLMSHYRQHPARL